MNDASSEEALINDIASFTHDPLGFANYAFPWGEEGTELEDQLGPRVWQSKLFNDLGKHLQNPETRFQPFLYAVASGHGIGKALCEDTMIPTPNGDKLMKDLKVGDLVFGSNGQPTKIIGVKQNGIRPTYKVTFDDGSFVYADENHDWNVKGRQDRRKKIDKWRTLSTKQILDLGVQRPNGKALAKQWEIPTTNPVYGSIKFKNAYLVGVWIGDGCKNKNSYTKPDQEIRDKLKSQGIKTKAIANGAYSISGLGKVLRELGLFDLNSYQRFLPEVVWTWDAESRLELLRGLLDTDGECNPRGTIIYSTSSARLIKDVMRLARSLGFKAQEQSVKKAYIKDVRHRDCYRITITMPIEAKPFVVSHKKNRVKKVQERYLKRWIESIEKVEDRQTICIEVDAEDHLYLANDYIVTHNSAEIGMLLNWGMSTCEDCKVVITSNTETQLRTKTMPEVAKWFRLAINSHWWKPTATSIFTVHKKHEKAWRADAVTWSENNTEAFAGLHNKKKRIILVFDEASAISDKVWEVAEGALTDEETEIIWIAFGNPTRNTGRFKECFGKFKHRWHKMQIDSREVEGTNKEQIQKWIDDYGVDSDFVKVRVRGIFPSASFKQFISLEDVDHAYGLELKPEQYNFAPKILTVDPAWEGDDEFVIGLRQGLKFEILRTITKNDNDVQMASLIASIEDEKKVDAVFIDAGYGTGIVSAGKTMGRKDWMLVWFSGKSNDQGCLNKRAEMWKSMRDWLKDGGSIPKDPQLHQELISPETVPRLDGKIQIESKKDMKSRGEVSPNRADALALSFAYPVGKKRSAQSQTKMHSSLGTQGWMG